VKPLSVALPTEAILHPQPSNEPDFMITSDSDVEEEIVVQINLSLDSNSPSDIPSSSNQACSQTLPTLVSPLSTRLLNSTILQEVCENIFKDLNKLVKTRNNSVHVEHYVDEWTRLRKRVDFVMCEFQKTSLEAHDKALSTLNEWFSEVVKSMEEVEVTKNQERSKLYISDTPIFMDASSIITATMHSENPDFKWLTKLKVKADALILEKLKNDYEQEKRIKKLEKELLKQRLMYVELQRKMIIKQEEAKVIDEALVKGYNDLKESMEKQSDKTNSLMQKTMEMMKKQAKP